MVSEYNQTGMSDGSNLSNINFTLDILVFEANWSVSVMVLK